MSFEALASGALFPEFSLRLDREPLRGLTAAEWLQCDARRGFTDTLAFAALGDLRFGLRAQLGVPLEQCPVVELNPATGESALISDNLGQFVPGLLLRLVDAEKVDVWDAVAAAAAEQSDGLHGLHQALGGEAAALDRVIDGLTDPGFRKAGVRVRVARPSAFGWSPALASVFAGTAQGQYYDFLSLVVTEVERPEPDVVVGEPWTRLAWVMHAYQWQRGPGDRILDAPRLLRALMEALYLPAGHEGGVMGPVAGRRNLKGEAAVGFGPAWLLGEQLRTQYPEAHLDHPLVQASRAMLEAGPGYDGLAHGDAAVALQASGDALGSLAALQSMVFFQLHARGAVLDELIQGYRVLAAEVDPVSHGALIERSVGAG